jgi:copper transport protein
VPVAPVVGPVLPARPGERGAAASVTTIPFDVGTPGGRGAVQPTLDPGRTGDNTVRAVVLDADGALTAVPGLRLSFTLPDTLPDRGGYWSTSSVTLPLPAAWTVRTSGLDQTTATRPARTGR